MFRTSLVLGLVLVAGCGQEPPDRSRLTEGQKCITFDTDLSAVVAKIQVNGQWTGELDTVGNGDRVMVLHDSEGTKIGRPVTVLMESGKRKGEAVKVDRINLRPVH